MSIAATATAAAIVVASTPAPTSVGPAAFQAFGMLGLAIWGALLGFTPLFDDPIWGNRRCIFAAILLVLVMPGIATYIILGVSQ